LLIRALRIGVMLAAAVQLDVRALRFATLALR
jgi:hypothetical protein